MENLSESNKCRILIVDDDQHVLQMISLFLSKCGYDVVKSSSASHAETMLDGNEFDAVLTDVMMPEVDGIEFLASVHNRNPRLPVILMTGYAQLEMAIEAIKKGAFDFIHKPVDFTYLKQVTQKAVEFTRLIRMELNYRQELEKTVAERTAELKEAFCELEKARTQMAHTIKERTAFLSTVSHELRTPMNGIVGALDLLSSEKLPGPAAEYLALCRMSSEAMLDIVEKMISGASRLRNSETSSYESFDPKDVLEKMSSCYQQRFSERGLLLETAASPDIPKQLRADREHIVRVLEIIIGNALKFTEHGGAVLELGIDERTQGSGILHFVVGDTGPGIPEGMEERIFEPFVQVDGTLTRKYGGIGLGLSIARQSADLMGGRIWVEKGTAGGSRFHLTVPYEADGGTL